MKKIRLFVFVLLCSLFVVHGEILAGQTSTGQQLSDCPTSPINGSNKENQQPTHGTTPIIQCHPTTPAENIHTTTPVHPAVLAASLTSFPSFGCLCGNDSSPFSSEDLCALHSPRSPSRRARSEGNQPHGTTPINEAHGTTPVRTAGLEVPVNQLHGTTPVRRVFLDVPVNSFHGTTPVK